MDTSTPLSPTERARKAGLASAAALTPEQRKLRARRAHFASCVAVVIDRAHEATPEQLDRLRALFNEGR